MADPFPGHAFGQALGTFSKPRASGMCCWVEPGQSLAGVRPAASAVTELVRGAPAAAQLAFVCSEKTYYFVG